MPALPPSTILLIFPSPNRVMAAVALMSRHTAALCVATLV
jgi:hypothetical protein